MEAYQKMLGFLDRIETIERALEQSKRGQALDAKEVFERIRAKYGIPGHEF